VGLIVTFALIVAGVLAVKAVRAALRRREARRRTALASGESGSRPAEEGGEG
jgi:hypothetical protein